MIIKHWYIEKYFKRIKKKKYTKKYILIFFGEYLSENDGNFIIVKYL